jgi:NAD(P)-dependent dehydrogenase (short-subunit alcohol dehydrogenase family)
MHLVDHLISLQIQRWWLSLKLPGSWIYTFIIFHNGLQTYLKNDISVPMKRLGSVEEVIQSVAFLLSEDSSYTTAFNLVVDGGLSGGLH